MPTASRPTSSPPPPAYDFTGQRVLVTRADAYMGPALTERFTAAGADVIADTRSMTAPGAADAALQDAGPIDVLIANLDAPATLLRATTIDDAPWLEVFDELVHSLMRLVRGALPMMLERRRGKIVAITSSMPLHPIAPVTAYATARGAQHVFVQHVGVEVARHGVNINAIAQNFVENPAYYPPGILDDDRMRAWIERVNPSGRLAAPWESAELALFLAGPGSDFLYGQVIPYAGGSAVNV
ncbi:MAG: SDR family oxidoreductase [Actinomycetota bacterium]|nr:SDR family oxidoreductase [Actinomycetota bacterium]